MTRPRSAPRMLLSAGAAAGPVFVAAFLADGATRPGYDPLRHPVSSLVLGSGGWRQRVNFAVTGSLYLMGAVGLGRARGRTAVGPVLVGAAGAGLLGAGAFRADPVSGYPPGTPAVTHPRTTPGAVHDLFGLPVFLGIPAAAFIEARRARRAGQIRWALASAGSGAAMLAFLVVSSAGFAQQPALVARSGLFQRASIISAFGWLTALMLRAALLPVSGDGCRGASATPGRMSDDDLVDEPGDAVCWLPQLCPECGAMPSGERPECCWRCGAPVAANRG